MNVFKFIIKIVILLILIAVLNGMGSNLLKSLVANSSIGYSLISFLIFLTSTNLIIRTCQFIYRKRKKYGHKYSDNVILGLQNIYYMLTGLGVTVMVLGFFGFKIQELLTSLSIVAAALAIISKELVTDIICGINISFSRELAIGDYVRIGEHKGKVVDLNIHKIVLQNDDDDIIFISNTKAYFSDIVNFTQKEIRKYNLEFSISNQKNITKIQLEAKIKQVLDKYTPHYEVHSSNFRMVSLNREEVKYKLQFKLIRIDPVLEQEIKSLILNEVHLLIHGIGQ